MIHQKILKKFKLQKKSVSFEKIGKIKIFRIQYKSFYFLIHISGKSKLCALCTLSLRVDFNPPDSFKDLIAFKNENRTYPLCFPNAFKYNRIPFVQGKSVIGSIIFTPLDQFKHLKKHLCVSRHNCYIRYFSENKL